MSDPKSSQSRKRGGLSRRDFLKRAGIAAGGLAAHRVLTGGAPALAAGIESATRGPAVRTAADKPELVMWSIRQFLPESNQWLIDSAQMAAEEGGFNVRVELLPLDEHYKIHLAAAEAGTLPDVDNTTLVGYLKSVGAISEVPDLFDEVGASGGGFYDAARQRVTMGGRIWAIPLNAEPWFMHYRKSLFEAAGFKPPFATLKEFVDACKAVTNPAKNVWGFGGPMSASDIEGNIVSALHAFGGKLFDENDSVAVNTPESLEGLTFYTDLLLKHKAMPPGVAGWDSAGNNQAYLSGQAASVCNTGSIVLAMRKDNPALLNDTVIGPWPAGWTDGGQKTATVPGFGLVINTKTRYPEQARQVIRKITSPERYPGQLEAAGSYWFSSLKGYGDIPFFTNDPWNRAIQQDVMPFGRNVEWAGGPNPVFDEIRTAGYLGNMLARVTVDGWEPQRALDEFEAKAKEIEAKYKTG